MLIHSLEILFCLLFDQFALVAVDLGKSFNETPVVVDETK